MSVLVHGEEKRESVVRELHGVGLEHREARAVGHDDVVSAFLLESKPMLTSPCLRPSISISGLSPVLGLNHHSDALPRIPDPCGS